MKLNKTAIFEFASAYDGPIQFATALVQLLIINILPITYARLLFKNRKELGLYKNKSRFGTLYQGMDLDDVNSKMLFQDSYFRDS